MPKVNLSVRSLAAFAASGPDLHSTQLGAPVLPEVGILRQQQVQAEMSDNLNYRCEVPLHLKFSCDVANWSENGHLDYSELSIHLRGRVDGLQEAQDPALTLENSIQEHTLVEEFKCQSLLPSNFAQTDYVQLLVYAGMHAYMYAAPYDHWQRGYHLVLSYITPVAGQRKDFHFYFKAAELIDQLSFLLLCYCRRLQRQYRRLSERDEFGAKSLQFPYNQFRTSQKAIMRRVHQGVKGQQHLLLEAPTGSGKTIAMLYPVVRAMSGAEQIVYLTSRNLGANAAFKALSELAHKNLVAVELRAKEKVCLMEQVDCRADICPYAKNYFERNNYAVNDLLQYTNLRSNHIQEMAQRYQVCPHELSLDVAQWADVVVGDYNYVFDPQSAIQRFIPLQQFLLVDESHQLSGRVQDMLSTHLDQYSLYAAKTDCPTELQSRLKLLTRSYNKITKHGAQESFQLDQKQIEGLDRAIEKFIEEVAHHDLELEANSATQILFLDLLRWLRARQWLNEMPYLVTCERQTNNSYIISLKCIDAGKYISTTMQQYRGSVRFSGTVSPLHLFQQLHGFDNTLPGERAASPFPTNSVGVFVVNDVPTYYRQRQQSLDKLAQLILQVTVCKPGRYLLAFPSYAYLNDLRNILESTQLNLLCQEAGQDLRSQNNLLDQFEAVEEGVLCIVLGGVFSESVDFLEAKLQGVMIVSIGLPPPSLSREFTKQHFDERVGPGWGNMVAYTQPALTKVIQAAGRLLRDPQDRGVVILVDERYLQNSVQSFFPEHWQVVNTAKAEITHHLEQFWTEG